MSGSPSSAPCRSRPGTTCFRSVLSHSNELDEVDSDGVMVALVLRIDTDETLFDAMRAATWTTGGPDSLVRMDEGAEVEPEWDRSLQRIPHTQLRDHLRMLSLTAPWARGYGAHFLGSGPGTCPFQLDWVSRRPGHETIAGWEFGEGQASSAVFTFKH